MSSIAILFLMETRGVGSRVMGAAGGMYFSAGEIGGVLGPLSVGAMFDATGGFSAPLLMLSGVCVALLLLVRLRVVSRRNSATHGSSFPVIQRTQRRCLTRTRHWQATRSCPRTSHGGWKCQPARRRDGRRYRPRSL